jgi:hypothetical protein
MPGTATSAILARTQAPRHPVRQELSPGDVHASLPKRNRPRSLERGPTYMSTIILNGPGFAQKVGKLPKKSGGWQVFFWKRNPGEVFSESIAEMFHIRTK